VYLWFYNDAKSDWTASNADVAVADNTGLGEQISLFEVEEANVGVYVPFRLAWVNTQICG
jgi:hypothetical protein